MKKRLLNLNHRYFKYARKYRNLYLRIREMLKSGIFHSLSVQAQRALQRKLDIYFRRIYNFRIARGLKIAMLAASFGFISQVMQAQSDSTWVEHAAKDYPIKEFKFLTNEALQLDIDGDGDFDIINTTYNRENRKYEFELWKQTPNPNERFVKDYDWERPTLNATIQYDPWIDFNQDGFPDRIDADGGIVLQKNDGTFNFTQVPDDENPFFTKVQASILNLIDFDNDGDLDVLLQNGTTWKIVRNNSGNTDIILDDELTAPVADMPTDFSYNYMFIENLDDDLDKEIILQKDNGEIKIYDNDFANSGKFILKETLNFGYSTKGLIFIDLDNDGDLDIINSHEYSNLGTKVFMNKETGFELEETDFFTPNLMANMNNPSFVDLDCDGDLDMVGAAYNYSDEEFGIKAFENIGDAETPKFLSSEEWEGNKFDTLNVYDDGWPNKAYLFNVDSDPELEAIFHLSGNLKYYEENNGVFTQHDVIGNLFTLQETNINIRNLIFIDYDNDNDEDIIIPAFDNDASTNKFIYVQNQGTNNSPNWVQLTGADNPLTAFPQDKSRYPIHFIDVNNDGKTDMLVTSDNPLSYFENTSDGSSFSSVDKTGVLNAQNMHYGEFYEHLNKNKRLDILKNGKYYEYCPILNVNDASISVNENSAINSIIDKLPTEYYESDSLKMEIISGNDLGLFALTSKTDTVKVNANIDYESIQTANLEIKATTYKETSPSIWTADRTSTGTLTININNVNDNTPAFDAISSNLSVNENSTVGTELLTLTANDADGNLNALSYSTTETKVAVDATTGKVTILDAAYFDAETNANISFDVKVSDGTNEDTETVDITINNVNDNTPDFASIPADLNINENSAAGTELLTISATDADGTLNSLVYSSEDARLVVNASTGVVTLAADVNLDYETATSLQFEVKVSDGTNQDTENVSIAINNVNDNTPDFASIPADLNIDENSAAGTALLTISATDADGLLNTLVYSSEDARVVVDASTGAVTLAADANLDYETATSLQFDVKVSDGTNEDTETVNIAIKNVNDNAPEFAAIPTDLNIDENSAVGTALLTISANDADGALNSLVYSSEDARVVVDASTGAVTLAADANLDYETAISLQFDVKVFDGTNEDTETVNIAINNVNDNAPAFVAIPTDLNIDENSAAGASLLTILANDADGSLNSLVYSSEDARVVVDASTGEVSLAANANLDYETATSLQFGVKVFDGTNEDTETVNIAINNVNDNAPVFDEVGYAFDVKDNVAVETIVGSVSGTDIDNLETLSYSIPVSVTAFAIDVATGEITVADQTVLEQLSGTTEDVTITLSDGENSMDVTCSITVINTTGIHNLEIDNAFKVYPNPNNGIFTIEVNESIHEGTISVINMLGAIVYQTECYNMEKTIDVSNFGKGIFFVKIESEGKTHTKKIIVK